jgi:NTP pyrophosphatase (non-canonical NTP hydrolase)
MAGMSSDAHTALQQPRELVAGFAHNRDRQQFHTLKDLPAGLSMETSELLELFLWKSPDEVEAMVRKQETRLRMTEELADTLIFCLNFANRLDLGLASSVIAKVETNAAKYPVDTAKGSAKNLRHSKRSSIPDKRALTGRGHRNEAR